ncbi:MAG TPA: MBL fold metallo-hydrolase [Streptosporangiaceae bacterium]|nr:MBL fold metallo-hydrolase [Streptosporangiaceae bacterium]
MEIAEGVHRIETPLGDRVNCVYLFAGTRSALLFDTAIGPAVTSHVQPYLASVGVEPARVRYVVNSHCDWDHHGGNGAVHDLAPAAVLCCHELDRPLVEDADLLFARRYDELAADGITEPAATRRFVAANTRQVPMDLSLSGGERFCLGSGWAVDLLHTPGHSRGHVSIHDPRSHTLVVGDAVLGNAVLLADGSPAFPPTYRYVDTYLATAQRLQAIGSAQLLTAHYPVYRGPDAAEFLGETRAFADRAEAALRRELAAAPEPVTMRVLTERLGPVLGRWPADANQFLSQPLLGHLERLERHGLVHRFRTDAQTAYAWVVDR